MQDSAAPPKPKLSKTLLLIVVVLAVTVGLIMLIGHQAEQKKAQTEAANKNMPPQVALTVTTTRPEQQLWPKRLEATGNVAAWQEVVIGSEVTGQRLMDVRVNVGDVVQKGQVLATINTDQLMSQRAQVEANIAEAKAVLADASQNAERAKGLQNSGALSSQEVSQYLTAKQTAQARLEAAQAQLKSIDVQLQQSQIVAPDAGVISARQATTGSMPQIGQELFRMILQQRLEWRAEVTASELSQINTGMSALITPADPRDPVLKGTVRMVAPSVDTTSRNALVYVDLPIHRSLRAGMFVKGQLILGEQTAMTLPQSAILLRDGFAYVFVVQANKQLEQRKVELGRHQGERVEVLGLTPALEVVADGTAFLSDGDTVRVVAAAAGSTQGGTS